MANLVGKSLGKYRIVARLGRGGMAEVYKAFQPGLNRYVSIKVLHSHMVEEENFVARFEREALAIGKLRHPNIVQAFDFDREDDISFMAMEFIDGPTLKDELQARQEAGKPYSLKEIARVFIPLCSAIDYAHARQMIHRDLKPANVMINQQGQIVLTDFGITRIIGGTQYTQTGALSGTPAYMSPEQGQGQHGDERSDIYSLGVMLYEMVTGAVPFDADTPFVVILKHISEPVPPPSKLVPDLPQSIEQIVLKAMSKEPADRYQRAGELAVALREATGLASGEEYLPLPVIALRPQIKEIDPTIEHFPVKEKPPTGPLPPGPDHPCPRYRRRPPCFNRRPSRNVR
ncbi:MAG: serine/threonine protein kinase [Anaerolineales bacterium]|nr:serine/threonine protein kinase [Anaerolineales bacterium]